MRPLVVGYVINNLEIGGAERLLVELATRLDRSRIRPLVFAVFGGGPLSAPLQDAGIPVYLLSKRLRFGLDLISRLTLMFRKAHVDIVHTHLPGADLYGTLAAIVAGVHLIVTTRHSTLGWSEGPIARWIRHHLQRVTQTIAVSRTVAAHLAEVEHLNGTRVSVIHNGVDTRRYAPAIHASRPLRTAAVIGRLDKPKGQVIALEAMRLIEREGLDLHLEILGGGPMVTALRERAAALGLRQVRWLGERTDVVDALSRVEAVVVPSLVEGLPMVILEAMAAGKLVIASQAGGIPEIITNGVHGYLVPPGDVDALAGALRRALASPAEIERLRLAGLRHVREAFEITRTVAAHTDLYEQLWRTQDAHHD